MKVQDLQNVDESLEVDAEENTEWKADGFGRDNLWSKPWGRLYSAPPYRTDEKECRTRVSIDYGNGYISLERPDWTAAQLPEPWVREPPRTKNDPQPWLS